MFWFAWLPCLTLYATVLAVILRVRKSKLAYAYLWTAIMLFGLSALAGFVRLSEHALIGPQNDISEELSLKQKIQSVTVRDLRITTFLPAVVIKGQSINVVTTIYPVGNNPQTQPKQYTTPLNELDNPNVPIIDMLGAGYDVSAQAELSASAFDVDTKQQPAQSLNQTDRVTFDWTVLPQYAGKQDIDVTTTGIWTPHGGGTPATIPIAHQTIVVHIANGATPETHTSFVQGGQFNIGTALTTAASAVLINIPLFWKQLKKIAKRLVRQAYRAKKVLFKKRSGKS